jgi:hypothetical protein
MFDAYVRLSKPIFCRLSEEETPEAPRQSVVEYDRWICLPQSRTRGDIAQRHNVYSLPTRLGGHIDIRGIEKLFRLALRECSKRKGA